MSQSGSRHGAGAWSPETALVKIREASSPNWKQFQPGGPISLNSHRAEYDLCIEREILGGRSDAGLRR